MPHCEDFNGLLENLWRAKAVNAGSPRTFVIRAETFTFEQVRAIVNLVTHPEVGRGDVQWTYGTLEPPEYNELGEYWSEHGYPPRNS